MMELRQIVRNQKLKNFDLRSLIKERSSSSYEEYLDKAPQITNKGKEGQGSHQVSIRTALNYKIKGFKDSEGENSQSQRDAYAEAIGYLQDGIYGGEIERSDIGKDNPIKVDIPSAPRDSASQERPAGSRDPEVTQDPKDRDVTKSVSDFTKKPDDEHIEGDKKPDKTDAEVTKLAAKLGFKKGELPKGMMEADPTILTALERGFHKGADWIPAPGSKTSLFNETMSMVATQLILDLNKKGIKTTPEQLQNVLGNLYGETTAWKDAAEGKPEQVKIVVEAAIQKAALINKMAEEAGIDLKTAEVKNYYGTRTSLVNQHDEIMSALDDENIQLIGGNGKEIERIPTDILSVHQLLNYNDKDGKRVSKEEVEKMIKNPESRESIVKFLALSALNGGGGGNPSDTATIVKDGDKMAFLAYSDKTSLADQQANSTPSKFIETMRETIGFLEHLGYEFDEKERAIAEKVLDDMSAEFKKTEREIGVAMAAPLKAISDSFADKKNRKFIQDLFNKEVIGPDTGTSRDIAAKIEGMEPDKTAFSAKANADAKKFNPEYDLSWGYYLKQVKPDWKGGTPTDEQKLQAYLLSRSDTREFSYEDKDGNVVETTLGAGASSTKEIEYLSKMVSEMGNAHKDKKNKFKLSDENADAVLNLSSNIERLRKKSFDVMTAGFAKLNEQQIEDQNGQSFGLGDMMGGFDLIEKLHLYMVDDNPSGLYACDSVFIIAGDDGVSPENMKKCLGVDSTEELLKQIKTEPPEKEGPTIDYIDGEKLHESELSRSGNPDELARTKDGKLVYLIDGEYVTRSEDEDPPTITNAKGKEVPAKPLGRITGRKVLAYIQDDKGERIPIGYQTYRTKGGYKLQTTYIFSPELQKCLRGNKITNEAIALLGDILAENKENYLSYHLTRAEEDYSVDQFIREINEGSLN
tara:strand:+ start:1 stop:2763 length:2763 start_codon:yes stop_codon:yes gene_type:complete